MITGKLTLYTYHKETKKGYPIKILITNGVTKKTKPISLNLYSSKNDWDESKIEPKRSHSDYVYTLEKVLEFKIKLVQGLKRANQENWTIDNTISYIKHDDPENQSFTVYADNFINQKRKEGSESTANTMMYAVKSFKKFMNKNDILFSEVNDSVFNEYMKFGISSGLDNSTYITKLKTICNHKDGKVRMKAPKKKTINKHVSIGDLKTIVNLKIDKTDEIGGVYNYRNYFLLCFYLGGIDFIDLFNLRYDEHVLDGRIEFQRFKGGTEEWVNNVIVDEALEILKKYDCYPYLVPIFKAKRYKSFIDNYNTVLRRYLVKAGVKSYISSKTPRYTFINIGKELGIPRDLREEIVGHARSDTHAIYEDGYSLEVKDKAFRSIVNLK